MIDATVRYVNDMGQRRLLVEITLPQHRIPELEAVQLTDLLREYASHLDLFLQAWHEGLYPTPQDVPWEALFPQPLTAQDDPDANQPEANQRDAKEDAAEWPKHTQENVSL